MTARLAEAVLRDERAVLPVAAYPPRYDVTLSLVSRAHSWMVRFSFLVAIRRVWVCLLVWFSLDG